MKKHSTLLWLTALILGWSFDLLFWKQPFSVNFAVYVVLCLGGGFLILLISGQKPARGSVWLVPLILLFAAVTVIRAEPMTDFLAVLLTLLLLIVLSNTYLGGRWFWYGLADYFNAALRLAGSMIARPVSFNAEIRREEAESGVRKNRLNVWPYVRGVLIALPILAVFAALLASADAVFDDQLNTFLEYFAIQNLPQYIFRMVYILIGAYLLVGVFLHASTQSRDEKLLGTDKPVLSPFLGFTEATIVLGSVAILFAAFVIIQFRYFFGGQANISLAGFTYADYARRGFGELVAVAFFSLLLILGLETVTRRPGTLQGRIFSSLSVTIVALVLVMLVSAYQRLILYERAYGFSRLRTYTHVALLWIGLLLVAVVLLEMLQLQRAFAAAMLVASLGFAFSLAALNVDSLIVRENVQRVLNGQDLDVSYLDSLSPDAVPTLVDIFSSPSTPDAVREPVGAVLFCRQQVATISQSPDWRAFTFTRWQADLAEQRVAARLSGYQVLDKDWPVKVVAPSGAAYECYAHGGD